MANNYSSRYSGEQVDAAVEYYLKGNSSEYTYTVTIFCNMSSPTLPSLPFDNNSLPVNLPTRPFAGTDGNLWYDLPNSSEGNWYQCYLSVVKASNQVIAQGSVIDVKGEKGDTGGGGDSGTTITNYVKLTGETKQIIDGTVGAKGDIIAYSNNENIDITSPIASTTLLGYVKIGSGLSIDEDGTLSTTGSGGSGTGSDGWNDSNHPTTIAGYGITDAKIENGTITIGTNSITPITDISGLDTTDIVTISGDQTITGAKTFTKNIVSEADVIAYSKDSTANITGPIASNINLGYVKVGSNLTIDEDGTLNAQAGGITEVTWDDVSDKPSTYTPASHTHTWSEVTNVPKASTSTFGVVKTSSGITNNSGVISVTTDSIGAATSSHTHSELHTHSNKAYLDSINQNLATTSNVTHAQIKSTSDVIAYSTGSATAAAFKYWKPSVDSNGNLSWTNTSDESAIATVNIKGPAGTGGWAAGDYTPNGDCRVVSNDGTTGKLLFINNSISTALRLGPGNGIKAYAGVTSKSQESTWTEKTGKIYLNGNGCYIAEDCSIQGVNITASKNIQGVNITATDTVTYKNLKSSSDIRLKDKVSSLSNVLDQINTLDVFSFKWKEGDTNTHIGVAAQEVQKVFPDLVNEGIDGYLSMDYQGLSVVGMQAIKELYQLVKDQQEEINQLKEKLNDITK